MKSIAITVALSATSLASPTPDLVHRTKRANSSWSGWANVKNLFVFGDSYTQTGFDVKGTQPNAQNPLGNPTYPGWTSSNGPNWVGFLTTTYNASFIKTYNVAYGGATVDSALVAPYTPTVLSLKNQTQDLFLPTYGRDPSSTAHPWTAWDSLFAFFIGINDVGNSWWLENSATLYSQIFTVYDALLEQIYATGGRNFLFLNVPPVNLAPLTLENGEYAVEHEGIAIQVWNEKVRNLTAAFGAKHADAKLFVHDTWRVYRDVIEDPGKYEQTKGIRNVTGYCKAYENGTPTWYTKDPSCAYAVNEYLWLNNLHPTFPIHNATAASIAKFLSS
ncbi:carbohydrate esterase family 16 protein [Periconia macrospinosa]|uniref:Carbohydrate esterase family 16 protein n=1 Tax=Periconia macrospinosa TaxID=97972 RepID=A0A2V1D1Z2_9PLEO|nr:carbohydrate esterase family 16 protein [Periconia macrospinosa]